MMLARFAFMRRPYRDGLGLFVTRSKMPIRFRRMQFSYGVDDACASQSPDGACRTTKALAGMTLEISRPRSRTRRRDYRPAALGMRAERCPLRCATATRAR